MSQPSDDKSFEEYLGRESQLSKRYRTLAADEVPAELDRRVLAQAQAAVVGASSRKKPAWVRWSAPLALAASMVLAISIVIENGTEHEVRMRELPAVRQEKSRAESLPDADLEARMQGPVPAAPPPSVVILSEPQVLPIAPAMMPAPAKIQAPAPPAVIANSASADALKREDTAAAESDAYSWEEAAVTTGSARREGMVRQGAGPRGTVQSATADERRAIAAMLVQEEREKDPKVWLEYIRQLRRGDQGEHADREWKRFHETYPHYEVDEKDVARAKQ